MQFLKESFGRRWVRYGVGALEDRLFLFREAIPKSTRVHKPFVSRPQIVSPKSLLKSGDKEWAQERYLAALTTPLREDADTFV
jgi:hypothetical protein